MALARRRRALLAGGIFVVAAATALLLVSAGCYNIDGPNFGRSGCTNFFGMDLPYTSGAGAAPFAGFLLFLLAAGLSLWVYLGAKGEAR